MKFKSLFISLIATAFILSCSSSDDSDTTTDNFNRKALLEHTADQIIIPALQDLSEQLGTLKSSKDAFINTPNEVTLETLRSDWLAAYKTWQYVEMFNIGMSEEILYSFQMNIYPTNVTDIQNNINAGSYDLTAVNNNDAVGFPAVDYLLYGIENSDVALVSTYTTSSGHRQYLSDVIDQMETLTLMVLNDWTNSYRSEFVNSTGNTASSAVNKLINDFIFYYEKGLRANKIGIPAGVFSTTPLNDKVEGFYSQIHSKELALESLKAVKDFFNGNAYNSTTTGLSYADYATLLRANSGTSDLTEQINSQLDVARSQMMLLDSNLSDQVLNDNTAMLSTYDELQRVVVLLKVDLLQTLNISVDFVDADGD